MSDERKAVFLSYASQDAEAAKCICESLRQAGVEVWFDQNELVGGDAWDAKIRKQIRECALFVPIISANTQVRLEGYFRIEWKLAAQRTHAMAAAKAFLLPIVIDQTRDAHAHVPEEFLSVQWTRLIGGAATEAFCARVAKLVDGEPGTRASPIRQAQGPEPAAGSPAFGPEAGGTPALSGKRFRRRPVVLWSVGTVVIAASASLALWQPWKTRAPRADATTAATLPISEANRLVAKAWELMDKTEMARNELVLAESYCRQAATLDEANPSVWAAWSAMNTWYYFHQFERVPARREAARDYAQKALALDPKSYEARYSWAHFVVRMAMNTGEERPALPILRELLRERPDEPRALYALGFGLICDPANVDEGFAMLEWLAAKHPWFAGRALNELGWMALFYGRFGLAESAADRALNAQPYWNNLGLKATLALRLHGDVELAQATIDRLPPTVLQENWGISLAVTIADWRGDHARAVAILETVSRDWLENFFYLGPTSLLSGMMRLKAKQVTAAEKDFRRALEVIAVRLEKSPNDIALLWHKAEALRLLEVRDEADKTYRQLREVWPTTFAQVTFEPPEQALDYARQMLQRRYTIDDFPPGWWFTAASLRLDPMLENVRRAPGFKALLEAEEQREKRQRAQAMPTTITKIGAPLSDPSAAADKSVAVLAFANLSDDKTNESFSDGISEELLNVLGKVPGLKVAGRTSSFSFKGRNLPVAEIARQLGVAYLVDGSVRKEGTTVRISAQLIKASDGFQVWSDKFERELKGVFALQDEIAGVIAINLELKMGMTAARPTIDGEAYEQYLSGRAAIARAGMADLRKAVTHLERAVAVEPKFTAAWVQLAAAHTRLGRWGGTPTLQAWSAARAAIARAQTLEPDSPEVLLALGWIRRTADWDWRGAEQAFRRALQLQPNQPDALTGAAVLLFNIGRTEEAFRLGRQAAQLDPLNPSTQIDLSLMFFFNRNWAEAERSARRALQLAPGGHYHGILSWSLTKQQRYAEAEAEARLETDELEQANALCVLALTRGQDAAIRECRAQLESIARKRGDDIADLQQSIAWVEAGLGNKDRAFGALEKARASRDPSMAWLRSADYLTPLYSDPRWDVLLRQMGLADDQLK